MCVREGESVLCAYIMDLSARPLRVGEACGYRRGLWIQERLVDTGEACGYRRGLWIQADKGCK
jgi:hypothetical protein